MKKTYIIIIVIIIVIIGMVALQKNWKYIESDIITEDIEREKEENLDSFLKDFYENEPSLISYGDVVDIKYDSYYSIYQTFSTLCFKTNDMKEVKGYIIKVKNIENNEVEEIKILNKNTYADLVLSKTYIIVGIRSLFENIDLKNNGDYYDKYDFSDFTLTLLFSDKTEEEHHLVLDKEAMIRYYENQIDFKNIIKKSIKKEVSSNENYLVEEYLTALYYMNRENYIELYNYYKTIYKDHRNVISKHIEIFRFYISISRDYTMSKEEAKSIFNDLKFYYGKRDDLSEEEKFEIITIMENLNIILHQWDEEKLHDMSVCFINGCKIFGLEDLLNEK